MKYLKFLVILSFLYAPSSWAQATNESSEFSAGSNIVFEMQKHDEEIITSNEDEQLTNGINMPKQAEVTIIENPNIDEYQQPTVQNLSKIYWKQNALDIKNDEYIDNFLLINECEIYQKFYSDDFEWLRVRKAARQMIEDEREGFPNKLKVLIPIDLGRYDMKKQGFPLANDTSFLDLRRVEVGGNYEKEDICGHNDEIVGYPRNIILVLNKPLNFEFLPLDEHIAQAYIIRQKYEPTEIPKYLRGKGFERIAFARMRISLDKYQGETKGAAGDQRAIVFGTLDGIDIFEDQFEKRLLKSIDY